MTKLKLIFYSIGFLRVRIGPETPKIGDLLKTTCGESEGDEGLEDHGVETEEGTLAHKKRRRRQDAAGDLASLGICLGDILPVKNHWKENKLLNIFRQCAKNIQTNEFTS
jgi:hypothetical protein